MNISTLLKNVGGSIIRNVVPGGGMVMDMVNEFLPDDKKLNKDATGEDVKQAIDSLPPDVRERVLSKQLDVQMEEIRSWTSIQDSLAKADASGASTRPRIALMMAWLVVLMVVTFIAVWGKAILYSDNEVLKTLANSWELMLTMLGTPTALLRAYFGMRTKEKKARYQAAAGQPIVDGILSLLKR